MKRPILVAFAALSFAASSVAQNVNIPDNEFLNCLLSDTDINTNFDNVIQVSEAEAFTGRILCLDAGINDLTGLEAFINLTELVCGDNSITEIDITPNQALWQLSISENPLETLDVSGNPALAHLVCRENMLTEIDVSNNPNLLSLDCATNDISTLDVSNNPLLQNISINETQIGVLDLSANGDLDYVSVSFNENLVALNVQNGNNTAITANRFLSYDTPNLACIQVDDPAYSSATWQQIDQTNNNFSTACIIPCNVQISDPVFRDYLIYNTTINPDQNIFISCEEAANYTGAISLPNYGAADFTGLEQFVNITSLDISGNSAAEIDISSLTQLTFANLANNDFSTLDVSANTLLTELRCSSNGLTALDVSNLTALETLRTGNNDLTALSVSTNTALEYLDCSENNITTLDVSNNGALEVLGCSVNQIALLDVSANSALISLSCRSNGMTFLNVANGNNTNINTSNMRIDNNPDLTCAQVDDVDYSTTNWTFVDAQTDYNLDCSSSCIITIPDANFKAYLVGNTAINANGDTEIQCDEASAFSGNMDCSGQSISDLTGIEAFTALTYLWCYNNQLTSLDLSANTAIVGLRCSSNQLTNLDLSDNNAMSELICHTNQLTSLNIPNTATLMTIWCYGNQLSILDLSPNTGLTALRCEMNELESLNMANGNNANVTVFNASNNTNLTCITVDDATYSTTNWSSIDTQTSFDTNCNASILVSSIAVQGQNGINTIDTPNGMLQMEAAVLPANADDNSVSWTFQNLTGTAVLMGNGLLTATGDGTIEVTATANDGSGATGSAIITISNQSIGIAENSIEAIRIYPNPAQEQLYIDFGRAQVQRLEILDFAGKIVNAKRTNLDSIELNNLSPGIYLIKIYTKSGTTTSRFVKQ